MQAGGALSSSFSTEMSRTPPSGTDARIPVRPSATLRSGRIAGGGGRAWAPIERLMRRVPRPVDGFRILELSADPLVDALDVTACDGDVSELLDALRGALIDVQFGRHAGLVEPGGVADGFVAKPVDVPGADVRRRKPAEICSRSE